MKLSTFKRKFNKAYKLNHDVFIDFKGGFFIADSYECVIDNVKREIQIHLYKNDNIRQNNYIGTIILSEITEVS